MLAVHQGVNLFMWSPNGAYGASAGHQDKTVFVWRADGASWETIDKVTCRSAVLGLSWSPSANVLALVHPLMHTHHTHTTRHSTSTDEWRLCADQREWAVE